MNNLFLKSKVKSVIDLDNIEVNESLYEAIKTEEGKILLVNQIIEQMVREFEFEIYNEEEDSFVSDQFKLLEVEVETYEGGVVNLVKDQLDIEGEISEDDAYYALAEKFIEQFRANLIANAYCEDNGILFNQFTYNKIIEDLSLEMGVLDEEAKLIYPFDIYISTSPMGKLVHDIMERF